MTNLFSNVGKLFSYNWNQVFSNIIPTGEKRVIQDEAHKNVSLGAIVSIIAIALYEIAVYMVVAYVVAKAWGSVFGSTGSVFGSVLSDLPFGDIVVSILTNSIIPVAILVYNILMKNKQQPSWFYFITLIVILLSILYTGYTLFYLIIKIGYAPLIVILGLVFVAFRFLGNVSIAVGCVDFCLSFPPKPANTNQVGSYQPNQNPYNQNMNQPMNQGQPMNQNMNPNMMNNQPQGNMAQGVVTCPTCGMQNPAGSQVCQGCGNRLM